MKNAKPVDQMVREFVKKISEDDLRYLNSRLGQRLGGDLGEAMVLIQAYYPELNRLLSSATNADELYNTIDAVDRAVQEAVTRRPGK